MAVSAAKFQSVTGFQGPVTAEVASSSLVVPASFFNNLRIWSTADQGILRYNKRPIGGSGTNPTRQQTSLDEG
jgi:hypothetical protein